MIEDFEDWRLKCLMLVKRWHHIEPSGISETLLSRLSRNVCATTFRSTGESYGTPQ
jgi:hypothetical protein